MCKDNKSTLNILLLLLYSSHQGDILISESMTDKQ